jgi:hypothetical protein
MRWELRFNLSGDVCKYATYMFEDAFRPERTFVSFNLARMSVLCFCHLGVTETLPWFISLCNANNVVRRKILLEINIKSSYLCAMLDLEVNIKSSYL